ncbi:hypothetical protein [Pueribacillus sp. YX66]|uniref:hypothetical protein n=1 Tax=Pueribacillus sp. YX66 TaxID=3229242 RepID=UPI00358D7897
MKYKEAKRQFEHALKHQKTISIPKLRRIMQAMNITLEPSESKEVRYLKNEIKKLRKQIKGGGRIVS